MPDAERRFSPQMYWVGHIATLVSILALFATLIVAYLWRSANPKDWHPVQLPKQLWLSTVLLLLCSASIEVARWALRQQRGLGDYARWLRITGWIALAFFASQILCWRLLDAAATIAPGDQNRGLFYILSGTHAVHILGGLAALGYLLWRLRHPWLSDVDLRRSAITFMLATYWHFMAFIWIALYLLFLIWQPRT